MSSGSALSEESARDFHPPPQINKSFLKIEVYREAPSFFFNVYLFILENMNGRDGGGENLKQTPHPAWSPT